MWNSAKAGDKEGYINSGLSAVGAAAGAYAGLKAGLLIGTSIGGPVGAVVGALSGALIGATVSVAFAPSVKWFYRHLASPIATIDLNSSRVRQ